LGFVLAFAIQKIERYNLKLSTTHETIQTILAMIYKFEPLYMERVWGGNAFESQLGRKIPPLNKIGESWDLVDREDHQSVLLNTSLKGTSLRSLIENESISIMGPLWAPERRFPILVKWLDCNQRLSLQVHPPSKIAQIIGGEPKTENWYVAHATPDAGLFIGLKDGTTKEIFADAIKQGTAEYYCNRVKSKTGSSVLVESGRLHAIDAGNLILEIQQNSDTTFRVYDWGRSGLNGLPRELHIEESMRCIDFNDVEPNLLPPERSSVCILADCPLFRIRKFTAKKGETLLLKESNQECMILNPVGCDLHIGEDFLPSGTCGMSPYSAKCNVSFSKDGTLLVTDRFYRYKQL
jgi:mannose-6-phosphate isomerase